MPTTISSRKEPNLAIQSYEAKWQISAKHEEIAGPSYFRDILTGWKAAMGACEFGLVLVPQEGDEAAGESMSYPTEGELGAIAKVRVENFKAVLDKGQPLLEAREIGGQDSFFYSAVVGNFGCPIGFLWCICDTDCDSILPSYSELLADIIEKSKKSRLHQYLASHFVRPTDPQKAFSLLADMLRKGLYNEMVIIWEPDTTGYSSYPSRDWDLFGTRNMVNRAYGGETIVVPDVENSEGDIFLHSELIEAGIKSFVLMPMKAEGATNQVSSVVGVFYRRVGGTTNVDIDLISFIVNYFASLSSLRGKSEEMGKKLEFFSDILRFHQECVECMTDLHEFPPIFGSLEGILARIDANSKGLEAPLKDGNSFIKRGQFLLGKHSKTFSHATSLDEAVVLPENPDRAKISLKEFFSAEEQKYAHLVKSSGADLTFELENAPPIMKLDREYVRIVFDNFVSNACHALKQHSQGERSVLISASEVDGFLKLTVKDTGPGIEPWLLPHVFTNGVTSRKATGGRGLGLALVWRIGIHYGRTPTVSSNWGFGASFSSWLKHEGRFDAKGRTIDKN